MNITISNIRTAANATPERYDYVEVAIPKDEIEDILNALKFMARFRHDSGKRLKKKSGSEWEGHVVGFYSTKLTAEGYAIESKDHKGSVQIYPVSALEVVR